MDYLQKIIPVTALFLIVLFILILIVRRLSYRRASHCKCPACGEKNYLEKIPDEDKDAGDSDKVDEE